MKLWLIFEEGVHGALEICYERFDSGMADGQQALDAYRRDGRTVRALEVSVSEQPSVRWVTPHDNEVDCTCACQGCQYTGHCGVDYTGCRVGQ